MLRKLLSGRIAVAERRLGAPLEYLREMLAVAAARVLPTVERGTGHALSCSAVKVEL